ncbi:MAG: hypothetical protein CSH37_07815 [Thalassolituus sp.]|jgi:DNA-binding MarR family transcriptional regulator|nr:MAG: hypothetical protein CSH37_07815 [Thalassolituus sp.]
MSDSEVISTASDLLHGFKSRLQEAFTEAGIVLSPVEFKVLRVIQHATQCTSQDLVRELERDKAQIARIVAALNVKELINREPNPNDKRSQILSISAKGNDVLVACEQPESQVVASMIGNTSCEDREQCLRVLRMLHGNLCKGHCHSPL